MSWGKKDIMKITIGKKVESYYLKMFGKDWQLACCWLNTYREIFSHQFIPGSSWLYLSNGWTTSPCQVIFEVYPPGLATSRLLPFLAWLKDCKRSNLKPLNCRHQELIIVPNNTNSIWSFNKLLLKVSIKNKLKCNLWLDQQVNHWSLFIFLFCCLKLITKKVLQSNNVLSTPLQRFGIILKLFTLLD